MYKEIILSYESRLDDNDLIAIRLFNSSFSENEIKLEHDNNRVVILLREVDIQRLKEVSSQYSCYIEKSIFQDVVSSIEK